MFVCIYHHTQPLSSHIRNIGGMLLYSHWIFRVVLVLLTIEIVKRSRGINLNCLTLCWCHDVACKSAKILGCSTHAGDFRRWQEESITSIWSYWSGQYRQRCGFCYWWVCAHLLPFEHPKFTANRINKSWYFFSRTGWPWRAHRDR